MKGLRLLVLLVIFVAGCGGNADYGGSLSACQMDGNSFDECMHLTGVLPKNAVEASADYNKFAEEFLKSYFYELQQFGRSSNPDTLATSTDLGAHLTVYYKGNKIYDEVHEWGIYLSHGFLNNGAYVILIHEYDPGAYSGITRIYIDGVEKKLPLKFAINNIRDFGFGWLFFQTVDGSIRTAAMITNWEMYNVRTVEFLEFGAYGTLN